jgi:hypothetical protein
VWDGTREGGSSEARSGDGLEGAWPVGVVEGVKLSVWGAGGVGSSV